MIRARFAAALLLLTLAGCSGNPEPAAAPSPTTVPSSATSSPPAGGGIDKNRQVCRKTVKDGLSRDALMAGALEAEGAPDPGVAAAGTELLEAVSGGDQLAINAAQRKMGAACSALFGDGGW